MRKVERSVSVQQTPSTRSDRGRKSCPDGIIATEASGGDDRDATLFRLRDQLQQLQHLSRSGGRRESFDYYAHPTERHQLLHLSDGGGGGNELTEDGRDPNDSTVSDEICSEKNMAGDDDAGGGRSSSLRTALRFWKSAVLVVSPLVFMPVAFAGREEANTVQAFQCAYVLLVMASFWVTECIPLAITSLIPVVMFPLFEIMTTDAVCREYLKETNQMLMSGLIVAIAVEHCNLHKRISLGVLLLIGTSPRMLILGFMLPTAFLSMWISNTATTAMMVPIVEAVLSEIEKPKGPGHYTYDNVELEEVGKKEATEREETESAGGGRVDEENVLAEPSTQSAGRRSGAQKPSQTRIMMFLSVAYAANAGGTGTLTGTGPNLVLKGMVQEISPHNPINFLSWMMYNVPSMIINLTLCWLWLQIWFLGLPCFGKCKKDSKNQREEERTSTKNIRQVIKNRYDALGKMSFHEGAVLSLFIVLVILWCFRDPQFIPGWGQFFQVTKGTYMKLNSTCTSSCTSDSTFSLHQETEAAVDDATAGMFIVLLLFVLPAKPNFWPLNRGSSNASAPSPSLLTWQAIHDRMPWSLILLVGGGFALAKATKISGLSQWAGDQLKVLDLLDPWLVALVVIVGAAAATEVTSNVATTSIILPILKSLATSLKINPLYLMLPATLACSYAFMLPVATPPNAIVYSVSGMKTIDMVKCGFFVNILHILTNLANLYLLGGPVFDLHNNSPEWVLSDQGSN